MDPSQDATLIEAIFKQFAEAHSELVSPMGNIFNGFVNGEKMTYSRLAIQFTLKFMAKQQVKGAE